MQKKAAGKKSFLFPGCAAMGRQCYCSAGLINSDGFCFLLFCELVVFLFAFRFVTVVLFV